jgi:hypothetical protein
MTISITTPKANVPVGRVTINGQTFDVAQHPEFVRFFFDLFRRTGGTSSTEQQRSSRRTSPRSTPKRRCRSPTRLSPRRQSGLIDELRNEFSGHAQRLRTACGANFDRRGDAELAGLRCRGSICARAWNNSKTGTPDMSITYSAFFAPTVLGTTAASTLG